MRTFFAITGMLLIPALPGTAAQQMAGAGHLSPQDAGLFQDGLTAQKEGRLSLARTDYETLLARTPDFLPARFNLGLVLDSQGKAAEALQAFEFVRSRDEAFPAAQMFAGIEEFRLGEPEKAAAALQRATDQAPTDLRCWFWLARVRFAVGDTAEGKAALDKALTISPEDPSALYLLAQYQISEQDTAGAEHVLGNLIARYPGVPDFHGSLASVYYLEARLDKAEEEYRAQLKLDAESPQALSMIGVILLDRGRGAEAIPYLEKGLQANPNIAYLQRKMGQALLESGDVQAAIPHLLRATTLDTHEATAHFLLWKAYTSAGRKEDAQSELQAFRSLQSQPAPAPALPAIPAGGTPRP